MAVTIKDMQKQAKIFLRIAIFLFVILFLSSQELYARALHFIAYGDTRRGYEDKRKTPDKTQCDSQGYTGEES